MIGIVLAAGAGSRLLPLTESIPKTLLRVDGDRTILHSAVACIAAAGVDRAVIVTGFAAHEIDRRLPELEDRYGVALTTLLNPKAREWNNAYSLWLARDHFAAGAVLVNGDTLFPPAVIRTLVDAGTGADVVLAVDDRKPLAEEEMKVLADDRGSLVRISKQIEPSVARGEYIGVSLIAAGAAARLAEALEATWGRDPSLYYEDSFQELVDRGGRVAVVPIGDVEWVEVDCHADLERARRLRCRS